MAEDEQGDAIQRKIIESLERMEARLDDFLSTMAQGDDVQTLHQLQVRFDRRFDRIERVLENIRTALEQTQAHLRTGGADAENKPTPH
jgi:uncharacterized protein YukE